MFFVSILLNLFSELEIYLIKNRYRYKSGEPSSKAKYKCLAIVKSNVSERWKSVLLTFPWNLDLN